MLQQSNHLNGMPRQVMIIGRSRKDAIVLRSPPNLNEPPCGPTASQVEIGRKETHYEQDAALDAINAMIREFDDLPTPEVAPPQPREETRHVRHKAVMVNMSNSAAVPRRGVPKERPINLSLKTDTKPLAPSRMLPSRMASMPTAEESGLAFERKILALRAEIEAESRRHSMKSSLARELQDLRSNTLKSSGLGSIALPPVAHLAGNSQLQVPVEPSPLLPQAPSQSSDTDSACVPESYSLPVSNSSARFSSVFADKEIEHTVGDTAGNTNTTHSKRDRKPWYRWFLCCC
ncbi:hypothetical protein EDC01DRAFT_632549 [Geopyxis carbonaria]|nr:hypothetical protein EDC01DRAFT_632549 [Geopyxis carbonaria]